MKTLSLPMLVLFSSMSFSYAADKADKPATCLATREYITSLEYLREHKEFLMNEVDARNLAQKVSMGCTGASKRFIQTSNILIKAGVPSKKALEHGLKFANSSDEAYSAFLTVFKGAYIESLLDLNVAEALNVAMELSYSYEGNKKLAEEQFNKLVQFCVDKKSLDLPLAECARIATRVVKNAPPFDFKIADDFIELFNYLSGQQRSNLPTFEALKVAEHVTQFGPEAKKNFTQAYEYGVNKNGLDLTIKAAIDFGKAIAAESVKKDKAQ